MKGPGKIVQFNKKYQISIKASSRPFIKLQNKFTRNCVMCYFDNVLFLLSSGKSAKIYFL